MYEVFISFKEGNNSTLSMEDHHIAQEIYDELTSRNREVFFSPVTLPQLGESEWRKAIDAALEEINLMVVVGTSVENITSPQLTYEWKTHFLEEKLNGRKPFAEIYSCTKGVDINDLPVDLRNGSTNFDLDNISVSKVCEYLENKLGHRNAPSEGDNEKSGGASYVKAEYKYRFKYNAGYTKLIGRDEEISFLEQFCSEENTPVSWTAIYGKGGVGKSKLAFEFCRLMESRGWNVFPPSHAKTLENFFSFELLNIQCDTIVCFDYAKYELESIEELIKLACESPKLSGHKVRFILIEREADDLEEGFSARIWNYRYKLGNLELGMLDDDAILRIIEDYINGVGCKKKISDIDRESLITTLDKVDPNNHRPLFALFIADAWMDDAENLMNWDEEAAVKYVANKEQDRIEKVARNFANTVSFGKRNSNFLKCAVLMATLCGRIDFKSLTDTCCKWFDINESIALEMLKSSDLASEDILIGIEPDLVGEYVCIQVLDSLDESIIGRFFNELFENHFFDAIAYFDKMFDDYKNIFISSDWNHYCTEIEIPWNIKYIKSNMFRGFSFIKKIMLHEQINLICKGAFRDCDNLVEINFPHNLEIIESAAFMGCTSLESAMPDDDKGWIPSIISIGDRAFKNCNKLKNFRMPRSVKDIGDAAFQNCSELEIVEIPKDVTTIPYNAFENCTRLNKVSIKGKECIEVQSEAFSGCTDLKSINLNSVSYIGKCAFEKCISLSNIRVGSKCTGVGEAAFNGCRMLDIVDLSASQINVLGDKSYQNCENLKEVYLPETIKVIGEKCFANCSSLEKIVFPISLKKVKSAAFIGCNKLNTDSFGSSINSPNELSAFTVTEINDGIIRFITSYFEETHIDLPKEIISIGDRAFYGDENLISINIHRNVKKIGKEAFFLCRNLEKITGSFSGVKKIEERAFHSCKRLKEIPKDGGISYIADSMFKNCYELEEVGFNSRIAKIGSNAFSNCNALRRLSYKEKCKQISAQALQNCPNFYLSEKYHIERQNNGYYISGFIFKSFGQKEKHFLKNYLHWENVRIPTSCIGFFENPFENDKEVRKISIPNTVKTFINGNFSGIPMLETIELPEGVKTLKRSLFKDCVSLHTIKIGRNKPNTIQENISIGEGAFENCRSLKQIKLVGNKDVIQARAFKNCVSLSDIRIPEGIRVICDDAFAGCRNLGSIVLPNTVKIIGKRAFKGCGSLRIIKGLSECEITDISNELFDGCTSLSEIELPRCLTSISPCAFRNCYVLSEIDLFNTELKYIGVAAFQNCYMLQKIIIPFGVREIKEHTFKSCTQLTTVKLPPEIEAIDNSAFFGCNMLRDVDLGNKRHLTRLGNDTFANCHRIKQMTIPENVTKLPRGLFRGCVSLEQIILKGPIKKISVDCFKDCKRLTNVTAAEEITTVQAGAFRNCFELKDFHQFENVNVCEVAAFRGCISLEEIKLSRIRMIPPALFMGCVKLKTVYFPQVEQIDNYAFCECRELETAPIEHAVDRIGEGAFWNCYKLENVCFSQSMRNIHPSSFRNCESITEIEFPNGMERIQAASFRNAYALRKVTIPKSVSVIRRSAFRDCKNLTEVDIQSDHIAMERTAFAGCENLYYVYFCGELTAQVSAFDGTPCKEILQRNENVKWIDKITNYTINKYQNMNRELMNANVKSDSYTYYIENGEVYIEHYNGYDAVVNLSGSINGLPVKHICDNCFEDNKEVVEIYLPETIVSIGVNAFAGCRFLEKIELSNDVQYIGEYSFKFCSSLKAIVLPDKLDEIKEGTFMCCYNLSDIIIPRGVRTISSAAFWKCENLTAYIPSTVEYIETGAFKGCDKTKIHFEAESEDKYFEEWPFGEKVISEEYGFGEITSCNYLDKYSFDVEIRYNSHSEIVNYPDGFKDEICFTSEESIEKHEALIQRIQKKRAQLEGAK